MSAEAGIDPVRRLAELNRCDRLLAQFEPVAATGDPGAIEAVRQVHEARSALLGLSQERDD